MTINDKIIKNKLGLLNLAQELGNVSKACQVMGFSRDTFYRYKSAVEEGGVENLMDQCRRKPNLKNRFDPNLEERIVKIALENPALGQQRVSNELRKEFLCFSAAGFNKDYQSFFLSSHRMLMFCFQSNLWLPARLISANFEKPNNLNLVTR
jgi:hypothetical protein